MAGLLQCTRKSEKTGAVRCYMLHSMENDEDHGRAASLFCLVILLTVLTKCPKAGICSVQS